MKYGRKGSSHEKVEASPLVPAIRANTGVMQQIDSAIAVKRPAPINFLSNKKLFPKFYFRKKKKKTV